MRSVTKSLFGSWGSRTTPHGLLNLPDLPFTFPYVMHTPASRKVVCLLRFSIQRQWLPKSTIATFVFLIYVKPLMPLNRAAAPLIARRCGSNNRFCCVSVNRFHHVIIREEDGPIILIEIQFKMVDGIPHAKQECLNPPILDTKMDNREITVKNW